MRWPGVIRGFEIGGRKTRALYAESGRKHLLPLAAEPPAKRVLRRASSRSSEVGELPTTRRLNRPDNLPRLIPRRQSARPGNHASEVRERERGERSMVVDEMRTIPP